MKVKIGKYPSRLVCNIHTHYMDKKYGLAEWTDSQTQFEKFLEKLEDAVQSVYNLINVPFLDEREQTVKVKIDTWDTWSMDHTLAHIILPMLKQLKETKHGAPYVDPKDCPLELKPNKQTKKERDNGYTDSTYFKRWDWVLDEMIYAFDCKVNKDDVYMRFKELEAIKKEQARISNGFELFGKYYESLWD